MNIQHMNIKRLLLPCSLTCALVLTACGGGDGHKRKVNHTPAGVATTLSTQADTELKGKLVGVDADSDTLTFAVGTQPTSGTLVLNANGSFTYTPAVDSTGTDQFTYTVSDGTAVSGTSTVMITINPLDVAFDAYSRKAFAQESTAVPLPLNTRNVEQNVTDPTAYDDLLE